MEDEEMHDSYEEVQRSDARQVLRWLALGIDPDTGHGITGHQVLQSPIVIRSLLLAVESLSDIDLKPQPSVQVKELRRVGAPWLPEEDVQLTREFESRVNLEVIAKTHERTRGSITSRLVRLKLIIR